MALEFGQYGAAQRIVDQTFLGWRAFSHSERLPTPKVEITVEKSPTLMLPPGPMPIALLTAVAGQENVFLLPERVGMRPELPDFSKFSSL